MQIDILFEVIVYVVAYPENGFLRCQVVGMQVALCGRDGHGFLGPAQQVQYVEQRGDSAYALLAVDAAHHA